MRPFWNKGMKNHFMLKIAKPYGYVLIGLPKGAFNNYVGKILSFLNPPCPAWTVLISRAWTLNKPFFDSLPTHFVQVVIEWPLIQLKMDNYP